MLLRGADRGGGSDRRSGGYYEKRDAGHPVQMAAKEDSNNITNFSYNFAMRSHQWMIRAAING